MNWGNIPRNCRTRILSKRRIYNTNYLIISAGSTHSATASKSRVRQSCHNCRKRIFRRTHHRVIRSSEFMRQTTPFSGANIRVYWLRAHALGAERGIEVNISNETFVYKSNVH